MLRRLRCAAAVLTRHRARAGSLTLLAVSVVLVIHRQRGDFSPLPDTRCGPLHHPLSLLPLADGAARVQRVAPAAALTCLRRRRVSRVLFVGHSRLRQVFERLSERLALRPVTRGTVRRAALSGAPLQDVSLPDGPGWQRFTGANSTCLEAWPKPDLDGDSPPRAWCSLAAVGPRLTLEFRWRFALHGFLSTLAQLSGACEAGDCVDVLLLAQGLHFLVSGSFGSTSSMYAETLRRAAVLLRPMTARGTRVVWMLEHASNTRNRHGAEGMNDDISVMAPLVQETLLELDGAGVWVWSSHLEIVSDFLSRSCQGKVYDSFGDFLVCNEEIYHVNNASLARMGDEVVNFMCKC